MIRSRLFRLAFVPILVFAARAEGQEWVGTLKRAPSQYLTGTVTLEGVVAGAREGIAGASGTWGTYYLVDASDVEGLLVQTSQLPRAGARVRVDGLLREGDPTRGEPPLVLVETRRRTIRAGSAAAAVAAGSFVAVIALLVAWIRARREEQRLRWAQPSWLVPPPRTPWSRHPAQPQKASLDPARHFGEETIAGQYRRRKRALLSGASFAAVIWASSTTWVVWSTLVHADPTVAVDVGQRTPLPPPRRDSTAGPSHRVTFGASTPPASPAPPTTGPMGEPRAPAFPSPSAAPPPPASPPSDPALLALTRVGTQLVTALQAGPLSLRAFWPNAVPPDRASSAFVRFVEFYAPDTDRAQPTLVRRAGDRAEGTLQLPLAWWEDGGIRRTGTASFRVTLQQTGDTWTPVALVVAKPFP